MVLRAQHLDLVLEFKDEAGEPGDFEALFVVGSGQLVLLVLAGLLEVVDLLVEVVDPLVELVPLIVPIRGLLLLPGEPVAVFFLLLVELLLQLLDVPLVEAEHLLDLEVQGLDFLVFALDLALEGALFVHDLLVVQVSGLQKLVVGDVSERGLRSVALDLLVSLGDDGLELFLDIVVGDREVSQSQLVVSSEVQPFLDLMGQIFPGFLEQVPQVLHLKRVVGIAVLQLAPQALQVSLVKLRDLDLGQLDLPLVMLHDILDLMLELVVVLLDLLESLLLVALEIFVDFEDALDLFLLGRDDVLEDGDFVLVVGAEVGLSLEVGLALLGELAVVEPRQLLDPGPIAVVVLLQLIAQVSVLVDQPGDLGLSLLPAPLEPVVALLDLVLLLLDLVGESLDLRLMQVLELILVLLVLPDEVVLHVLVLRLDEVQLMRLLLL